MNAEPNIKPGRFLETILTDRFIQSRSVNGFIGKRLRANRLEQKTDGVGAALTGIDHTLVFHIGGGHAERLHGSKRTGYSDKLRTSTLIPAHQETSWSIPEEVDVLHLYMDDKDLLHFAESAYEMDPDKLEMRDYMGVDDPFMQNLAPLVLQELKSDLPQSRLMLDGFDYILAGHLLRAYSNMSESVLVRDGIENNQRDLSKVLKAKEMLLDRLNENVSAEEIGAALDTGPFRLMRLFKREVGLTMHQFVIKKRIEYVKDQLANSKLSLVQIAYDAGFSSQSHMNACYVKEMGISPGRHRQILKS